MTDKVDLLRKAFSAYNAAFRSGDTSGMLDLLDPDVEWHPATSVMDPVYRGPEGVRRWMTEFYETWDALVVEPEEFIDAGPDCMVVALRLRGRGRTSGIDVDMLLYEVFTIRAGKVVKRQAFRDKTRAFEVAGLSEATS